MSTARNRVPLVGLWEVYVRASEETESLKSAPQWLSQWCRTPLSQTPAANRGPYTCGPRMRWVLRFLTARSRAHSGSRMQERNLLESRSGTLWTFDWAGCRAWALDGQSQHWDPAVCPARIPQRAVWPWQQVGAMPASGHQVGGENLWLLSLILFHITFSERVRHSTGNYQKCREVIQKGRQPQTKAVPNRCSCTLWNENALLSPEGTLFSVTTQSES